MVFGVKNKTPAAAATHGTKLISTICWGMGVGWGIYGRVGDRQKSLGACITRYSLYSIGPISTGCSMIASYSSVASM